MITFTETFLGITMNYKTQHGYKGYKGIPGATHTINVYNISNKRTAYREGMASYEQTVIPTSQLYGREPDVLTIDGPLCNLTANPNAVDELLAPLEGKHPVNTLYNVFIPCCILQATTSTCPDIRSGSYWIVNTFKIKRNAQKRGMIYFELNLYKWYGGAPSEMNKDEV